MLIGSPPQKLKVALCYESYASTNGKVVDQIVLFKPKKCGNKKTRKSKTLRNLNQHTDVRRLFGGQIYTDRIALGSDAALMQNLSFVIADSKDSCKFAGLWPMDPIAKTDVWEPLLKQKPKPVVTITADTRPRINGVWSTGQLMIGSYNEKSCKPIGLAQYGQLTFDASAFVIGNLKVSWPFSQHPRGHLDLNSDRLEFGSEHYRQLFSNKKIESRNGRLFADCSSNWTIGYEMPKKSYVVLAKTKYIYKFEVLDVEPTKKKSGGRCELKLGVWKDRDFGFKAPAQLLDYYCVHQKYEVDDTSGHFEVTAGRLD
ncbi:hypothetical protein M3Y98_00089100 [Aphelenchoides besseyi]|nr:hypothetical protein M3Y98_00089100 [Aphelenchoides besseyi]KAI6198490.1 hypothetical protein M3Y96_00524600 [Aphelenchoides besseyi]